MCVSVYSGTGVWCVWETDVGEGILKVFQSMNGLKIKLDRESLSTVVHVRNLLSSVCVYVCVYSYTGIHVYMHT